MTGPHDRARDAAIVALGAASLHHESHATPSRDTVQEWLGAITACGNPWPGPDECVKAVEQFYSLGRPDPMRGTDLIECVRYLRGEDDLFTAHTVVAADITCPVCQAAPGDRCINKTTGRPYAPRVPGHPARYALAHPTKGTS